MMPGSEARDGPETGGVSSSPDPADSAAVDIAVGTLEMERAAGVVGGPKARGADAAGGCKVLVAEQQGKGAAGAAVAIDVGTDSGSRDWDREKVCRICHLSPGHGEEAPELIQLGCGCKEELGTAHRDCAEAWFRLKGNRCCEICGANAKNITGEEDSRFMVEWHEGRASSSGGHTNSSEGGGCWRSQPFCNFLMACLVIAFILPWFFRVNMF